MSGGCLDEHGALEYLAGNGDRDSVLAHLETCTNCRSFLLEVARAQNPQVSSGAATLPGALAPPNERTRVGRFEIIAELGAGAMGVVYRAEDPDLHRPVAIKVMRGASTGEVARTRMLREAQAMAQLDHPNVIRIYEVGTDAAGEVFIAMEYVDGTTLGRWLHAPRRWREIVDAFVMAGRGLAAAHAVGVIHRDFKPDNAMVDRGGLVKVGDFGLARAEVHSDSDGQHAGSPLAASMTQTGALLGTPVYMSPEQLEGQSADARSDQFALCVAFYEALFGERPFVGTNIDELRAATARGPRRPHGRGGAFAVWPVLRRGMAPDPEARFASISELLEALSLVTRVRRRRIIAGIATAALLAGGAGALVMMEPDRSEPDPTAAIWSPLRAASLRDGMLHSRRPASFVTDQATRAIAGIDRWIVDWHGAFSTVYRTAADDGPLITRHRRACLDLRLKELGKVIDLVAGAREDDIDGVVPALGSVRSPLGCTRALPSPHTPTPPPGSAERIVELSTELDLAEILELAGRAAEAGATVDRLEPELRGLGYTPLLAQMLYVRGAAADDLGERDRGRIALLEANKLAPAAADELLEIKILDALVFDASRSKADLKDAHAWSGAAEQALARARANQALPPDEVDLIEMAFADGLAGIAFQESDSKGVLADRERELAAARRARGEHSRQYAQALAGYGRALWGVGKLPEGRKQLEASAATLREVLGPGHPVIAGVLISLANAEINQADTDDARRDFEAALAILTTAYGRDHRKRLPALVGLANLENIVANSAKVIERTTEIIALTKAAYGDAAAELSDPLELRAVAQVQLGDVAGARATSQQAMAIDARVKGTDAPAYGADLLISGMIEWAAGEYPAARTALERAMVLRADDPNAALFVGEIDLLEGKSGDALRRFHDLTGKLVASNGDQFPLVAVTLGGEGRALVALGRPREALPLLERADALIKKVGIDGPQAAAARVALSRAVFAISKDRARARQLATSAREQLLAEITQPGARGVLADVTAWLEQIK